MTEAEFRALAALGYNRIPLVLEAFADLDTPLSLYLKLANQRYTYLLESVVGGERFGRYSFIGLPAKLRIRSRGRQIEVEDRGGIVERHEGDPLAFIGAFLGRYRAAPRPGLPRFCGGLAGYFGYDTVRHVETKLAATAAAPTAELAEIPDILLLLTAEPNADWAAGDRLQDFPRKVRQPVSIPYQTASEVTIAQREFGSEGFQAA